MGDRPPPRLRSPDRQRVLPPRPLEDLLDTDHQARLVWHFCLGLDLQPLLDAIGSREGGPGRAAIDPRLGVSLWLYATLEGVGSGRALAWLCEHHNAFRWLCGGVSVNHHTLSDFRVAHPDLLDRLLTHSVAVLREQGLVDLNRVAHDGMRVRAARARAERLGQALGRLPELEAKKKADAKEQARASATDPEATVRKMADGGYRPAYHVEYSADAATLVIAAVEVTTSGSDAGQVTPLNDQIHDRPGLYPRRRWTEEAKAVYRQRASTVACVNAQARNRGLIRLLVRGLRKVKAVALWLAIAHNLACGVRLRVSAGLAG